MDRIRIVIDLTEAEATVIRSGAGPLVSRPQLVLMGMVYAYDAVAISLQKKRRKKVKMK